MKAILALVLGMTTTAAFADGISLVCNGKSKAPRTQTKTGKVEITISGDLFQPSPNYYFYEAGYTFKVNWQDSSPVLKSAAFVCGMASSDAKCSLQSTGPNAPFSVYEACDVGAFDTRGLPHERFSSRLTLSGNHGFFYCSAHDVEPVVSRQIELSHCQPK